MRLLEDNIENLDEFGFGFFIQYQKTQSMKE